jgi:hypothetical protein
MGALSVRSLQVFLKVPSKKADEIANALYRYGLIYRHKFVVEDVVWLWPTQVGSEFCGIEVADNHLSAADLERFGAIAEGRLALEARELQGEWFSCRGVASLENSGGTSPDAVFVSAGKSFAVKVAISSKSLVRTQQILSGYRDAYDGVVLLCGASVRRQLLKEMPSIASDAELLIPELSFEARDLRDPAFLLEDGSSGAGLAVQPTATEARRLGLFAEQGAIPLDQLVRFWKCSLAEVEHIVDKLSRAGFVMRSEPLVDELAWVWLRDGSCFDANLTEVPMLGDLTMLRAANEARLWAESTWGDEGVQLEWLGGRKLLQRYGPDVVLPDAIVRVGDEVRAIELELAEAIDDSDMASYSRRSSEFSRVAVFCLSVEQSRLERFLVREGLANVWVPKLPPTPMEITPVAEVAKFRDVCWMMPLPIDEVPSGALEAIRDKSLDRQSPSVLAAQCDTGKRHWRVEVDDGVWQARKNNKGAWVATRQSPMQAIPVKDVPRRVAREIQKTAGLSSPPKIISAERLKEGGAAFRVITDAGMWRVTHTRWGWKAVEGSEFEYLNQKR